MQPSPIPEQGKGPAVQRLFGVIARRYDLANRVLSLGFDAAWRRRAARIAGKWQPARVLDLATGQVIASEPITSGGFCPVGFYVPDWLDLHDDSFIPGSEFWKTGPDGRRTETKESS